VSTLTHPRHGLQLKLRLLFNAYVQAQIDWIGNVHANTRQAGVLLPLRKFPSFVDASYAAEASASAAREAVTASAARAAAARERALGASSPGSPDRPRRPSFPADAEDTGGIAGNAVDLALQKVASALLQWLEKAAASKPKYADIVRLENYHFFYATLFDARPAGRAGGALRGYAAEAGKRYVAARKRYVDWVLRCQLGELSALLDAVERRLTILGCGGGGGGGGGGVTDADADAGAYADVALHIPKARLRRVVDGPDLADAAAIAGACAKMRARVRKHISDGSGVLAAVSEHLARELCARYGRLCTLARRCYGVRVAPGADEVRHVVRENIMSVR